MYERAVQTFELLTLPTSFLDTRNTNKKNPVSDITKKKTNRFSVWLSYAVKYFKGLRLCSLKLSNTN